MSQGPNCSRGHYSLSRINKVVSDNMMTGHQDYRPVGEIIKEESISSHDQLWVLTTELGAQKSKSYH